MLCRAALPLAGSSGVTPAGRWRRAARELADERYGDTPAEIAEAVRARYGKDRTFSVPILMTCALAGLVEWREVPRLPFELACLPQSWFRFARLPVVSYALPALIAIGQCVHHHRPSWNPLARAVRRLAEAKPARPDTHPAVQRRLPRSDAADQFRRTLRPGERRGRADSSRWSRRRSRFLVDSVRADGQLAHRHEPVDLGDDAGRQRAGGRRTISTSLDQTATSCVDWLLGQQYRGTAPVHRGRPGAWAWTPLPGGVPDADDTPGAMLALANLGGDHAGSSRARRADWLLQLAEPRRRHGRPSAAAGACCPSTAAAPTSPPTPCEPCSRRGPMAHFERLYEAVCAAASPTCAREQRPDGSWLPLWFGNQHAPDDLNPTYGTRRVLAAYRDLGLHGPRPGPTRRRLAARRPEPRRRLGRRRGTPSSVEETALAVEVLSATWCRASRRCAAGRRLARAARRGGTFAEPSPIGFYFAKLWYFERLYPLVFTVAALGRARSR